MCGIFGYTQLNEDVRLLMPYLAIEMEKRGKDAWGASDGQDTITRNLGLITDTYKVKDFDTFSCGIFHTRHATHGGNIIKNTHPFVSTAQDGGKIIGIHNGMLANKPELDTRYPNRHFEVDSQHIFEHIAQDLDLGELVGYGIIVWFRGVRLSFAKFNDNALHIYQLKSGPIVFCSEASPIITACKILDIEIKHEFAVEDNTEYYYEPEGTLMKCPVTMGFKEWTFSAPGRVWPDWENWTGLNGVNGGYAGSNYSCRENVTLYKDTLDKIGQYSRTKNVCVKCILKKVDYKQTVLCEDCLRDLKSNALILSLEACEFYV
jgi:hypothetical protein